MVFPNYRKTAQERQDQVVRLLLMTLPVVALVIIAGAIYIVLHFVAKYW